jgi:hypothetical protein
MPCQDQEKIDWTPEFRLELIWALAAMSYNDPQQEKHEMLMERIMFLCDMPNGFLEASKGNYQDAIRLAKAGLTVTLK